MTSNDVEYPTMYMSDKSNSIVGLPLITMNLRIVVGTIMIQGGYTLNAPRKKVCTNPMVSSFWLLITSVVLSVGAHTTTKCGKDFHFH